MITQTELAALSLGELLVTRKQVDKAIVVAVQLGHSKTIEQFRHDGWLSESKSSSKQYGIRFTKHPFEANLSHPYTKNSGSIELRTTTSRRILSRDESSEKIIKLVKDYPQMSGKWVAWLNDNGYPNVILDPSTNLISFAVDHGCNAEIVKGLEGWTISVMKPDKYPKTMVEWVISDYYAPGLIPNPPSITGITAIDDDGMIAPGLLPEPATIPYFIGNIKIKHRILHFVTDHDAKVLYPVGMSRRETEKSPVFKLFPIKVAQDYHVRMLQEGIVKLTKTLNI